MQKKIASLLTGVCVAAAIMFSNFAVSISAAAGAPRGGKIAVLLDEAQRR